MYPVNDNAFCLPQSAKPFGPALGVQYDKCINFEFYKSRAMKYWNKPYYFVANGWWHCISETDIPFPRFSMHICPVRH